MMPFKIPTRIEDIVPVIGAILAAIGLIAGIATAATGGSSNGAGSSSSAETAGYPQFVREYRATAIKWLEAQGYTVTSDANRQAQESADGYFKGDSMLYDTQKFESKHYIAAPAFYEQMTAAYKVEIERYNDLNIPKGSKGEAGIGIAYSEVTNSIVILRQKEA